MSRGDSQREFSALVLTRSVQKGGRLQGLSGVGGKVAWFTKGGEYVASLGPIDGLRVEPISRVNKLEEGLVTSSLAEQELDSERAEYRRYQATRWVVRVESDNWNLSLPEGASQLGVVPKKGGVAVLYADGALLEIWDHQRWVDYVRRIANDRDERVRQLKLLVDEM